MFSNRGPRRARHDMPLRMPAGMEFLLLAVLVLLAAVLYSSGGHAGASAYLAAMALFGVAPAVMKPVALVMNIAVATVGSTRFVRAKAVPWHLLAPLLLGSAPAAFLGGHIALPSGSYFLLLGSVLSVASILLWQPVRGATLRSAPAFAWLVGIGASLGFIAGLTGIGGGIFLSPLLILTGWEEPRKTSGAAAVFILVNSIFGLVGHAQATRLIPSASAILGAVAVAGGLLGSWLAVHRLNPLALRRVHATVVAISGIKLLWEGLGF